MSTALEKLRKRLSETDLGGGSDTGFWNAPDGDSIIRILPPVGKMDVFYQEVGTHFIPGFDSPIYCPHFTTMAEYDCPICEIVKLLGQSRNKNDNDLANKFRVRRRYWMNIIVRELDDNDGVTGDGPYIFTPGPMIMKQLNSLCMSNDYGDPSLTSPSTDGGYDISINRKGKKLDTDYNITPRRHSFPLHPNPSQVGNWLKAAAEILVGHLTDNPDEDEEKGKGFMVKILPYGRIIEETGISPDMNVNDFISSAQAPKDSGQASAVTLKDRLRKVQPASVATATPQPTIKPVTESKTPPVEEAPSQPDEVAAEIRTRRRQRRS